MPRPSSAILITIISPAVVALSDSFEPMTNGIAHEVHEWSQHPLDQKLVDLCFAAAELHDDLFAALPREVANHESHTLKGLADLDHAHPHDALAQIPELSRHAEICFLKRTPRPRRRHSFQVFQLILEPRTTDHEFADDPHQFVEPIEIDADDACRSERRDRLALFGARRRLNRSRLERQTISLETCPRKFVCLCRDNKLERNLAGAFDDRLCLKNLSKLLEACTHAVYVNAALGKVSSGSKLDLPAPGL